MSRRRGSLRKAGGGVVVTGFAGIDRQLKGLEPTIRHEVANSSLRKAAEEIILPDAVKNAPKDTGALKGALKVKEIRRSRDRIGFEVTTHEGMYKGYQYYAAFLEFGTKTIKARNFMRNAGYDNEGRIRNLVIDDIVKTLASMAAKRDRA